MEESRSQSGNSTRVRLQKGKDAMERLNKLIHVLEQGQVAFGTFIHNGTYDENRVAADEDYHFLLIEMEHTCFVFTKLVQSLEAMHNRTRIVDGGSLPPNVAP